MIPVEKIEDIGNVMTSSYLQSSPIVDMNL